MGLWRCLWELILILLVEVTVLALWVAPFPSYDYILRNGEVSLESPFEKTWEIQSLVAKAFKSSLTSLSLDHHSWRDDQKNRL